MAIEEEAVVQPQVAEPPLAKVNFMIYKGTLDLIQKFQRDFPDIDVHEVSSYINQGIVSMIKEYRQCHQR